MKFLPRSGGKRVAFGALLLTLFATGCDRGEHPGQLGRVAPDFTLDDGQHAVSLHSLRGNVVLLNFWATWCAPCIAEMPSLEAMQQQLPQVKVIAVDTDDDLANYRAYLQRRPLPLFSVFDSASRSNALYGTHRYPETYLIDRDGVIRRKFIGPQDWTSPEILDSLRKLAG